MRRSFSSLTVFAAALLAFPALATEPTEAQRAELERLDERLGELEVESAEDQQRWNAMSALSTFLSDTDFSGNVAASYNYNFMNPPQGRTNNDPTGITGLLNTHPQHNNFQLDQLYFGMANEANEDSRAGFGVDILYGAVSDGIRSRNSVGVGFANGNVPFLLQAYASYLFNLGNGVRIDGGIFESPMGGESAVIGRNYNITRGAIWGIQPVNFVGARTSAEIGGGFSFSAAIANSPVPGTNADTNEFKTGIFTLGWAAEKATVQAAYMYADDQNNRGGSSDVEHLVDFKSTWDPSDRLGLWFNFDWQKTNNKLFADGQKIGVGAASRYGITDKTGIAGRFEWLQTKAESFMGTPESTVDQFSLTGTADHELTDHLEIRGEVRWDLGENSPFDGGERNGQVLAIAQMIYSF